MNQYKALKDRQGKELNTITLFFAFSKEQLEKGMAEFGLSPDDTGAIFSLNRTGRYFRLSDETRLREMLCRHNRELWAAVEDDETGAGFILDMFACELENQEYAVTMDVSDTLDALDLTRDEIAEDPRLACGFHMAMQRYWGAMP